MNELEYKNKILEKYAVEKGITPRDTSDLSKLEEWLLEEMYREATESAEIKRWL